MTFSPDGTKVATASGDKTARIWDVQTGAPIGESLRHDSAVTHVAFSPDGTKMVTASDDRTARVWYVPRELTFNTIQLEAWCAALTGQRIDEKGDLKGLTLEAQLEARSKLDGIKKSQDYLAEEQRRHERFHWIEAEEAEFNKQWFAAAFHLRWAQKQEPGNEELKQRLAAAEQKLREEQEAAKQAGPKLEK